MSSIAVIGLEVHAQLDTRTKLFCACLVSHGAPPNTRICATCSGQPGVLPVLNSHAVDQALRVALVLRCRLATDLRFDRKHYFYPDLPKGYQITQYHHPLGRNGVIEFPLGPSGAGATRSAERPSSLGPADPASSPPPSPRAPRGNGSPETCHVRIERLHLEEDAGKSVHDPVGARTLIDLNRAGIPLIEVVTRPEIATPEQAGALLRELRRILRTTRASDAEMETGSLRCDVNVSLKEDSGSEPGVRVEIKNLNSIRAVVQSLHHEIARQAERLARGRAVVAETRSWNPERRETVPLRLKEGIDDYRYLSEPDLPAASIPADKIRHARETLPELPLARASRLATAHGLPWSSAQFIASEPDLADFFESCIHEGMSPQHAADWLQTRVLAILARRHLTLAQLGLPPPTLAELDALVVRGRLSLQAARQLLPALIDSGKRAETLAREKDLLQVNRPERLQPLVRQVISEEQQIVADYRAGKQAALNALVGKVMRLSAGKANPIEVRRLLARELDRR